MNPLDKPIGPDERYDPRIHLDFMIAYLDRPPDERDEEIDSHVHVDFITVCLVYIKERLGPDITVGMLRHLVNVLGPPTQIIGEIDLGGLGLESIRNDPDIIDPIPYFLDCISKLEASYGIANVKERLLTRFAESIENKGEPRFRQ